MSLRDIFYTLPLLSDKWDPYFEVYEQYFGPYVGRDCVFVEVGVQNGGSLLLWRKFLGPQATIIGVDYNTKILNLADKFDSKTHLVIGDQADPNFWKQFFFKHFPNVDIFLDDGGHGMQQQTVTFESVWPRLNQGGTYICEDTCTSYWRGYDSYLSNPQSFIEYVKDLVDAQHYEHLDPEDCDKISSQKQELVKDLTSISFYNSMVVFTKQGHRPYTRVFSSQPPKQ